MPVAKLDNAPRCQHTKLNGRPCAAPARRARKFCVFHEAAHAKRPDYAVRLVEDAMSLQLALFQVMRALDDHSLDPKRAALKLYALQIAASNLKRLHEETQEFTKTDDLAEQQSMLQVMLDQLHCPEEDNEQKEQFSSGTDVDFGVSGLQPDHATSPHYSSASTFTIKACAEDEHREPGSADCRIPTPKSTVYRLPTTDCHAPNITRNPQHHSRAVPINPASTMCVRALVPCSIMVWHGSVTRDFVEYAGQRPAPYRLRSRGMTK